MRGVQFDHCVKNGVRVRLQRLPVLHGLVPLGPTDELTRFGISARGQQAAFDVLDGFIVHRHHASARSAFNGHVAHRHTAFHAERANGRATKFNRVASAARCADLADDGQHDVLGSATFGQRAFDLDQQIFGFFGQQGLRGHDMLDLAGADAVGQRAKCAMGGRVRVATYHRHAGQGGPIFGANHMHNALAF